MSLEALSIRKKIVYAFFSVFILIATTALMTYGIVLRVERKVAVIELIDDFFNRALELRRFEKNYFLYEQNKDYLDALSYLSQLEETLKGRENELRNLMGTAQIRDATRILEDYRGNMDRLHRLHQSESQVSGNDFTRLQNTIREAGKKLTEFAESTARNERLVIKQLLRTSRAILLTSSLLVILVFLFMTILLGRKIVNSLKLLEGYARKISHGEELEPPAQGMEMEIHSVLQAFSRMNNELRLRQRQLVQSEKLAALGTLLAGVAHELNNPLSNISTSAQILGEELEGDDLPFKREMIAQIEEQTDRARDTVRTLLDFSRDKQFQREKLPLAALVNKTIRLLRSEVPSEVTVTVEIDEGITIHADKQKMQQVFLNLIKNSMEAMGDRGQIWISARYVNDLHREVEILVEDNGPGIPAAIVNRVFDPFYTTKDVGHGSGLGLFIVHEIIETHGGSITINTLPDEGTTFIIWLPGEGA
ncbi:MAG: ATP-binding protein [Thermodesulfobacteriota bacterium]